MKLKLIPCRLICNLIFCLNKLPSNFVKFNNLLLANAATRRRRRSNSSNKKFNELVTEKLFAKKC